MRLAGAETLMPPITEPSEDRGADAAGALRFRPAHRALLLHQPSRRSAATRWIVGRGCAL